MNLLYESLPEFVEVEAEPYPIVTDFKEWIRFIDMVKSDKLSKEEKVVISTQWFLDAIPEQQIYDRAIHALMDFLTMSNVYPKSGSDCLKANQKQAFSYELDAPYIIAGFQQCYGINLLSTHMHWWRFRALFEGLDEKTEIKQRIAYRSVNLNNIKDKTERARIRKIQASIALPREVLTDYDIGNAFA